MFYRKEEVFTIEENLAETRREELRAEDTPKGVQ
jgi:hypothetical protein